MELTLADQVGRLYFCGFLLYTDSYLLFIFILVQFFGTEMSSFLCNSCCICNSHMVPFILDALNVSCASSASLLVHGSCSNVCTCQYCHCLELLHPYLLWILPVLIELRLPPIFLLSYVCYRKLRSR